VRKYVSEDIHTQYVIRAEEELMKMSYKIYSYDDLPRDVKKRLSSIQIHMQRKVLKEKLSSF
jgi:hypothetical protein